MEKVLDGIIIKGIGGFYYVEAAGEVFECKARGAFRKKKITPLAGDNVTITVRQDKENTIDEIHDRKNFLLRPPVANIDTLIIVSSVKEPVPSLLVIDKLTAIAVDKGIKPCVVFSKSDLADTTEYEEIYKKAGIEVCSVCNKRRFTCFSCCGILCAAGADCCFGNYQRFCFCFAACGRESGAKR